MSMKSVVIVYVINVDWYFCLHWLNRAKAMKNTGARVHLVMGGDDADRLDRLQQEGFVCHRWNLNRKSMNPIVDLFQFVRLYRLLKTINPDLVHAITIKPNIFIGLLSYILPIPYVMSITGMGIVFSGKSFTIKCLKPIIRGLFKLGKYPRRPRKLIFENNEDRSYFTANGLCDNREAATILGAGVDTEIFKASEDDNSDLPVLLFAGRLLWDKGLGDLVAACRIVRRKGFDFSLKVAGIVDRDSVNAIDISVLEKWQAEGSIEWLGTESDMPKLLATASIVVLPTFYGEGVPRILIEAASCARPLIATDIAGCREIVKQGRNGLLIPPRDTEALAGAIVTLLQNPALRATMGSKGRELVENSFSERQVIAETLSLYKTLMK